MDNFLNFFNKKKKEKGLTLEITYTENMGYCIEVHSKYSRGRHRIVLVQGDDIEYCFALALVQLKDCID